MTIEWRVRLVAAVEAVVGAAFTINSGSDRPCIICSLTAKVAVDAWAPLYFASLILGQGPSEPLPVLFCLFFAEDPEELTVANFHITTLLHTVRAQTFYALIDPTI